MKFQASDLGQIKNIFLDILKKYQLENKEPVVLAFLAQAILQKISAVELTGLLGKELNLDYIISTNLGYDLKAKILDQKEALKEAKQKLLDQTLEKFNPKILTDEFLAKLHNFSIIDPNVKNRFVEAIESWLRGIRDIPELKEVLMRSDKIGGVNMSEPVFFELYDLLKAKQEEINKDKPDFSPIDLQVQPPVRAGIVEEQEIDVAAKPKLPPSIFKSETQDVRIEDLLKEKGIQYQELAQKEAIKRELGGFARVPETGGEMVKEIEEKEEFLQTKKELEPPQVSQAAQLESDFTFPEEEILEKPISAPQPPVAAPSVQPAMPSQTIEPKPIEQVKVEAPAPFIKNIDSQARPKMEDVKYNARLIGPIEELSALSIIDFRRLSKNPQDAAKKIMGKLDLLEDESIVKKVEGIKALKTSPLYKVYADFMNQAISQVKSIEQVIGTLNTLTLDEYKAITDLNKNLKY